MLNAVNKLPIVLYVMIVMVQLNVQNVKINIIIQDHHAPNAYQIVMNVIQPHALTVP